MIVSLVNSGTFSGEEAFKILKKTKTYEELMQLKGLQTYQVPVTIEGEIINEIMAVVQKQNLTPPQLMEFYRSPSQFLIKIINEDYPPLAKEMLGNIFNPVNILDVILTELEKAHDYINLMHLMQTTRASLQKVKLDNLRCYKIEINAKNSGFDYKKEEIGSLLIESWKKQAVFYVDEEKNLMRKMVLSSIKKTQDLQTKSPPEIKEKVSTLYFEYVTSDSRLLPSKLSILITPEKKILKMEAFYRKVENYILFDKKVLFYSHPQNPDSLISITLHYGPYQINPPLNKKVFKPVTETSREDELAISQMTMEANEAMEKGDIKTARKILVDLVKKYPNSPYATRANLLLKDLPE